MTLGERVRHLLNRNDHEHTRDAAVSTLDVDEFIASRRENLDKLSPSEIDRLTEEALATVDPETTLRESRVLRERWKSGDIAPRRRTD